MTEQVFIPIRAVQGDTTEGPQHVEQATILPAGSDICYERTGLKGGALLVPMTEGRTAIFSAADLRTILEYIEGRRWQVMTSTDLVKFIAVKNYLMDHGYDSGTALTIMSEQYEEVRDGIQRKRSTAEIGEEVLARARGGRSERRSTIRTTRDPEVDG